MLKKHKNPKGGLTQAGRDFFKRNDERAKTMEIKPLKLVQG